MVSIDRSSERAEQSARCRIVWSKALLHLRARQQTGARRIADGNFSEKSHRASRRGSMERPQAKAVVPGGISMGFMSADELDTPLDFNGPGRVGCLGLGTAAVIVIDDHTSMVDVLYNACRFFAHESCGQCTPCREGTAWSTKILERIRSGHGKLSDIDLLLEISGSIGTIPGTTICGLADGAAWPIKNAIHKFRPEFEEYIRSGRKSEAPQLVGAH
jgi:NADH-quinone oxidoreductase subunit F